MVVRFTWQPREWREAYLLSLDDGDRTEGYVPMGYLILGLMAVGGLGDLSRALRHNRDAILHESLAPVLLLVCVLLVLIAAALIYARRNRSLRELPALPAGEQQLTLHELGWGLAETRDAAREPVVRQWSELHGCRIGRRVLTLLTHDGRTVGLPLRALTADQGGWLERLLARKTPRFS